MNDIEKVIREEKEFHDRHSASYRKHVDNPRNRVLIGLRARMFKKILREGVPTLELGCGVGTWTRHFKDHVPLTGLDFSHASLVLLHENAREARRIQADVRHLPVKNAAFEQVFVGMVMHHLPYDLREQALNEVVRVLAPGGRLVLFEPNRAIRYSLGHGVRTLKKIPPFRFLLGLFRGAYEDHEDSPLDRSMGRNDEAPHETGHQPQGFYLEELGEFFRARGVRVRRVDYLHSLQLPTPKWFGVGINRIVVGILHLLERTFLRKAKSISDFFFLVGEKK